LPMWMVLGAGGLRDRDLDLDLDLDLDRWDTAEEPEDPAGAALLLRLVLPLRDEAVEDGDLEGRTGIAGGPKKNSRKAFYVLLYVKS